MAAIGQDDVLEPPIVADTARIGDYLIERLLEHGVGHVFGVPGDFVLSFFGMLEASHLTVVNTCDEQGAGFAADAYARISGLGVVCVTYGVGGLKIANTTGQAYAEESPVVVISGAPGRLERQEQPLLHHKVRFYETQRLVFDQLTVASTVLDDAERATREIDRVIDAALAHKRPVYIELPRDMVMARAPRHIREAPPPPASDPDVLGAAVHEIMTLLRAAKRPVCFLGVELARFGQLDQARRLIEQLGLPTTVTLLDKSAISEQHPQFLGVYAGGMSRPEVIDAIESSDRLLMLGTLLTDVTLGGGTAMQDRGRRIHVSQGRVTVGYHEYQGVRIADLLAGLAAARPSRTVPAASPRALPLPPTWDPDPEAPIRVARLFQRLGTFIDDQTIVIADPGDAMFGAVDLPIRHDHEFLANAFYASLGWAVPASIGAQLAAPDRRPLVLVGDGSFQMTGMELSTSLRFGLSPIVVILDNKGYAIERLMIDGPFNDVLAWEYTRLTDLFGGGLAFDVRTEGDLDRALTRARERSESLCVIHVRLDGADVSPALRRLADQFGAAATRTATVDDRHI